MDRTPEYWFNTKTGRVEEGAQSPASQLMGPYPDRETAARAFEIAAERNERMDAADEAWDEAGNQTYRGDRDD